MACTTLSFIDQGALGMGPSKSDRRIIRSHVMKGKNAGKPRQSTRRSNATVHVKHTPGSIFSKPGPGLLWNDLCLTSFPQQLDAESTKLMHRCKYKICFPAYQPLLSSLLTYFFQGSLILVMRCFRPNCARNST